MDKWTLYYNPKCGTCRNALEILNAHKIKPHVVEYLKNPPSVDELNDLLKKLAMEPKDMVREKESLFDELKLGTAQRTRAQWLKIIHENPVLIQRPIVVKNNRAIIARPAENIQTLL